MHLLGFVFSTLACSIPAISQVLPSRCDYVPNSPVSCAFLIGRVNDGIDQNRVAPAADSGHDARFSGSRANAAGDASEDGGNGFLPAPKSGAGGGFHWGRALLESFTLLSIEQAYVVHDDWRWVGGSQSENGVPFDHYWRDYKQSLSSWVHSGWNDGDPNMYGYLGHPIQGVATSYIYLQNDPKSEKLAFSKTRAYWHSRLIATLWNAAYSTQWNIGPLSEATVEKYGTHWRPPWNQNGSWPCTGKNCYTGMGQIDLVMTPVGGFGWLVGEDILDRYITRRVEAATQNRFLIDVTRCGLDPIRVGTNILHGKRPWYRPARDVGEVFFTNQLKKFEQESAHGSAAGENH
jgi:hypothetical protein